MEMPGGLLAFLAGIPIIVILILMVGFRWSATRTMPVAFLTALALVLLVWHTPVNWIFASCVEGIITAFNILIIVFGALALLFTLRECGALAAINRGFTSISPDKRIQAIIIAWMFGSFIEASAGFGTPAALAAPLLMSLGFPAMAAVMVALIANTTCVSFGSVGTPTLIGIGNSLNTSDILRTVVENGMNYDAFLYRIGVWTAIQHSIPGILIPLLMIAMMTRFFGEKRSFRDGLAIWPYALFGGLCFVVPYLLVAILLGPEFPSLIGGLAGMLILIPATKAGFLRPKEIWDFPGKTSRDKSWNGNISLHIPESSNGISIIKAWIPYFLIGLLLVLSRISSLPIEGWLKSIKIDYSGIFNTSTTGNIAPFYIPGVMPFMLVALVTIPLFRMKRKQAALAWTESLRRMRDPFISLIFAVPMVRLMIQSGNNPLDIPGMPMAMAQSMAGIAGKVWPLADPFIGALGAFMAGSNTVSNMLFSLFQYSIAEHLDISRILVVSLQNIGGALGNMICVHKIIAACATVGLAGVEGILIRRNLLPLALSTLLTGITGMILIYLVVPGLF
jgi:lactate permease